MDERIILLKKQEEELHHIKSTLLDCVHALIVKSEEIGKNKIRIREEEKKYIK